jgi:gp16 family phage-associated protein
MKTLELVKKEFEARGETFGNWADRHGFARFAVYRVVEGVNKGKRGKAYEIAKALGLK